MRNKIIKIITGFFALTFLIVFNSSIFASIFPSKSNNFISQAQEINSTQNSNNSSSGSNHTILSLIPLMIQEMKNTNATSIPIKQVINATPSNVTALQEMANNNLLNHLGNNNLFNNTSTTHINNKTVSNNRILNNANATNVNNFTSTNKSSLIPVVVNLTKNTNATDIALAKTINATPSNVTALQNMAKNNSFNNINNSNSINNILNNISNIHILPNIITNTSNNRILNNANATNVNNFTSTNKSSLIPVVVNLTKNTNATDIALAKTINATPSNVTAIQKLMDNNVLNNISKTIGNTMSISNTKNPIR